MKTAYIIPLLFLSIVIYGQETKQAAPVEDQTQALKQIKEHEAKLIQEAKENEGKKTEPTGLPSDKGPEAKSRSKNLKRLMKIPENYFPIQQHLKRSKERFPTDKHPEAQPILRTQIPTLQGCPIQQRLKK